MLFLTWKDGNVADCQKLGNHTWNYVYLIISKTARLEPSVKIAVIASSHTSWSRVLLEKLTGSQLVKKFPAFYGTRRFITAFTSGRQLFLSWASSIHPCPHIPLPEKIHLNIILHLCLDLPCGLFLSGFPTKTLYTPLLSSSMRATSPTRPIILDLITRTILGEEYRSLTL